MAEKTLSVLVPSFNSERYLVIAIDSALDALGPDDEVIVQDGGSNDTTHEILRHRYADDPRVRVFVERDSGQADALNRALAHSRTDLVVWMNADDVIFADTLRLVRQTFADSPEQVICVAGHRVLQADGSTLGEYSARPLTVEGVMRRGCYVFSGSFVIQRKSLIELGGFDAELHYSMDLDLMFRLCRIPADRAGLVRRPLGALRRHDESKSGTNAMAFVREGWRVRARYVRNWRDQVRRVTVAVEQPIVSAAKPIRFSRPYRFLRDRLWRRHG